jgi:hypothetical protein
MQPTPAHHLVRYRAEILDALLVNAVEGGLRLPSLTCQDVATKHRVWIPLPIISFSLPHLVKPCDSQSRSVIDLTED